MDELLRDIRTNCRKQMNGIASASMRKKGLNYKLNFGVPIQEIKIIAARYQPNSDLAEKLWLDETRELKILATLLYPIDDFNIDAANRWIGQIPNQEIREQVVFNLFQKFENAANLGLSWSASENGDTRATGYWLMSRLIMTKKVDNMVDLISFPFVWDDILSQNISLRNAAILFLKSVGRLSKSLSEEILEKLSHLKSSDNATEKEIYDSLAFEYEYLFD